MFTNDVAHILTNLEYFLNMMKMGCGGEDMTKWVYVTMKWISWDHKHTYWTLAELPLYLYKSPYIGLEFSKDSF